MVSWNHGNSLNATSASSQQQQPETMRKSVSDLDARNALSTLLLDHPVLLDRARRRGSAGAEPVIWREREVRLGLQLRFTLMLDARARLLARKECRSDSPRLTDAPEAHGASAQLRASRAEQPVPLRSRTPFGEGNGWELMRQRPDGVGHHVADAAIAAQAVPPAPRPWSNPSRGVPSAPLRRWTVFAVVLRRPLRRDPPRAARALEGSHRRRRRPTSSSKTPASRMFWNLILGCDVARRTHTRGHGERACATPSSSGEYARDFSAANLGSSAAHEGVRSPRPLM